MRTILLIGKTGQVGFELERALNPLGRLIAPDRSLLDLTDPDSILRVIEDCKPDAVVNACGFTMVDDAESQAALTMQLNAIGPGIVAEAAKRAGAVLLHFSSTYVFDGTKRTPYTEDDIPNPVNTYGYSKLQGENAIVASGASYIILRANWVYSTRRRNFALTMLKAAREQSELRVVTDQVGTPTWAFDYAEATAELLRNPAKLRENPGIYHLSAESQCTRMTWAETLVASARTVSGMALGWAALHPTISAEYPLPAVRPLYTVTSNRKIAQTFGISMPAWNDRTEAFVRTLPSG